MRNTKRNGNGGDVEDGFLDDCIDDGDADCPSSPVAAINKTSAQATTLGTTLQWDRKIDLHKVFAGATVQYTRSRYQSWEGETVFDGRVADVSEVTTYDQQADNKGRVGQKAVYFCDVYTPRPWTL